MLRSPILSVIVLCGSLAAEGQTRPVADDGRRDEVLVWLRRGVAALAADAGDPARGESFVACGMLEAQLHDARDAEGLRGMLPVFRRRLDVAAKPSALIFATLPLVYAHGELGEVEVARRYLDAARKALDSSADQRDKWLATFLDMAEPHAVRPEEAFAVAGRIEAVDRRAIQYLSIGEGAFAAGDRDRYERAVRLTEEAASAGGPFKSGIRYILGKLFVRCGEWARAEKIAPEIDLIIQRIDLLSLVAAGHYVAGRPADGTRVLRDLRPLIDSTKDGPRTDRLSLLAARLAKAGAKEAAAECRAAAATALGQVPIEDRNLSAVGVLEAYGVAGDVAGCRSVMDRLTEGQDAATAAATRSTYAGIAIMAMADGGQVAAVEEFLRLVKGAREQRGDRFMLAVAYARAGRPDEAIKCLADLGRQPDDNTHARVAREIGQALGKAGRHADAAKWVDGLGDPIDRAQACVGVVEAITGKSAFDLDTATGVGISRVE